MNRQGLLAFFPKQFVFALAFHFVKLTRVHLAIFLLACQVAEMQSQRPADHVEPVPPAPDYNNPAAWSILETQDVDGHRRFNRNWINNRDDWSKQMCFPSTTMYFEGAPWNAAYDDLT